MEISRATTGRLPRLTIGDAYSMHSPDSLLLRSHGESSLPDDNLSVFQSEYIVAFTGFTHVIDIAFLDQRSYQIHAVAHLPI
jgi:hypothetical protein